MLGGRRVSEGKVISRRDLGGLTFIPATDKLSECSFRFTVNGYASVGEIECTLKLIDRINYPPKADGSSEKIERTQASVAVWGCAKVSDPEGDELCYTVISYPENGRLSSFDKESGSYCYQPYDGYTGEDKFVYVARDSYGNYTYPITVKVSISERMTPTEYADMIDRPEYNAALAMTAMNVMNGRLVGDGVYFMPDEAVSRAEFLAMALKCAGIRPAENDTETFFDDDADIPRALKGYVKAAAELGITNGSFDDGKLSLLPNEVITKYEAAAIIAKISGIHDSDEDREYSDTLVPVWARGSVSAMYTLGIFDENDVKSAADSMSRAEAAGYLYRMLMVGIG